jgi:hypothetical protein
MWRSRGSVDPLVPVVASAPVGAELFTVTLALPVTDGLDVSVAVIV